MLALMEGTIGVVVANGFLRIGGGKGEFEFVLALGDHLLRTAGQPSDGDPTLMGDAERDRTGDKTVRMMWVADEDCRLDADAHDGLLGNRGDGCFRGMEVTLHDGIAAIHGVFGRRSKGDVKRRQSRFGG